MGISPIRGAVLKAMLTKTYKAIGLMSGSSLDGIDIAYCTFDVTKSGVEGLVLQKWKLLEAETINFSEKWRERLLQLPVQNALTFAKTHTYLGHYFGEVVLDFIERYQIEPDFIASHGHTIFHDPIARLTVQIGDGAAIAAVTNYPVISNFRNQDIAIDGEGAPVAPIVDKYLLKGYDFYLNIGGIANVTSILPNKIIAFDICPANQLLNVLANQLGLEYDEGGKIAASGQIDQALLSKLNQAVFYKKPYPKSLDNAFSKKAILSQIPNDSNAIPDQLATVTEHIAFQIARSIRQITQQENFRKATYSLLVTGGGAFNTFLIDRLRTHCLSAKVAVVLPDEEIIQFKEAILMAWMGVLRLENVPNVLRTVTGARRDSISGVVHQGWQKKV